MSNSSPPPGRPGPTLVDNREHRRKRKAAKRRRNLLALLLIVAALLLLIFRQDIDTYNIRQRLFNRDQEPVERLRTVEVSQNLEGGLAACANRDNVVLAVPNRLVSYRPDGSLALDEAVSLTTPAIACSDRYILAYDRGGQAAVLSNGTALLAELTAADSIQTAAVAGNGTFALVSKGRDVQSVVSVYNRRGNLRYEWNSASSTVSSVALSDDGRTLAVAGFTAKNAELVGVLRLINLNSEQPLAELQLPDELILALQFEGGTLKLLTDAALYLYTARDGALQHRLPHGTEPLLRFSLQGEGAALILGQYAVGQGGTLKRYDIGGELRAEVNFSGDIRSLTAGDDRLVLLQSGTATLLDERGAILETVERASIREAVVLKNGVIALIGNTNIALLSS